MIKTPFSGTSVFLLTAERSADAKVGVARLIERHKGLTSRELLLNIPDLRPAFREIF
jgi:hypothetical protein